MQTTLAPFAPHHQVPYVTNTTNNQINPITAQYQLSTLRQHHTLTSKYTAYIIVSISAVSAFHQQLKGALPVEVDAPALVPTIATYINLSSAATENKLNCQDIIQ
eukprot:jgi/Psemu1/40341/gm1.40341_g